MDYKIRNLKNSDVFKMSKILKAMNLKLDAKQFMEKFSEKDIAEKQMQFGLEMIKTALENLHLAENEVNEFLGGLIGITGEEFAELDIEVGMQVTAQFKELKGIKAFFQLVSKSMK
ncbi:hypothetical protein BHU72_12020 [Desulfuribacillus stibiiarsenatis]|uniref:Uncharacterized protein n=1 Tax=Desulfuribacillus stibiiarsenatis TaxID=1390249 RepID=A0A1E5L8A6_9FIRM|nr:hypothetical protein [Desulfuribacillus stibiiarsenatis]OEH86254.1 hypothetical protein BHU72_12020 [Desulfuribacillus stibiiarsenatis]